MTSLGMDSALNIPDDFEGWDTTLFNLPPHVEGSIAKVLIPHGMVTDRITKLARDITDDLVQNNVKKVRLLCVLKGGYRFFSDLQDQMSLVNGLRSKEQGSVELAVDFIRCKSYVNDQSTGEVKITGIENMESLRGQDVIVVEDIVDTGRTMVKLIDTLKTYEPKSLRVACLSRKKTPKSNGFRPPS